MDRAAVEEDDASSTGGDTTVDTSVLGFFAGIEVAIEAFSKLEEVGCNAEEVLFVLLSRDLQDEECEGRQFVL